MHRSPSDTKSVIDNQHTSNSTSNSHLPGIWQMKYYICSSTSPRKKRIYCRTSLIIMYYIASLAKFGNHCSTVWVHRQNQWEGNNYSLSFRRMQKKSMHCFFNIFSDLIFYLCVLQYFCVSKTILALACPVAQMMWHSCYLA